MQKSSFQLALLDITHGFQLWRIWLLLGWQDIRLRYRRSVLGPFWITLSMAIMIYSMGFLYGKLFKVDLSTYYPYLAAGLIGWGLISTIINDSTEAFFNSAHFIKQIKLPYSVYILRLITRNAIIFLHNLVAIIPILFFFHVPMHFSSFLLFMVSLALFLACAFCFSFIIALIGTRFQDIKQIIVSLIQIFFLLTPIMWMPSMIPERFGFLAEYNPFYQIMTLLRLPLMGQAPSLMNYTYTLLLLAGGITLMLVMLVRARHRIAFWL